jgi:hypothetical protein
MRVGSDHAFQYAPGVPSNPRSGTWPFGVVEAVWATIAVRRWQRLRRERSGSRAGEPG